MTKISNQLDVNIVKRFNGKTAHDEREIARGLLSCIHSFYDNPETQQRFKAWLAEHENNQTEKEREK